MGIKVLPPDVNESSCGLHRRRHRHPVRPGLGPQRRAQRRRLDRPGPRGAGRLQGLRRLPAQDRHGGLQQEGHRVPGQGRRLRLPRALPAGHRRRPRAGGRLAMGLKRKEAEGQFDLFGGFGDDGGADDPFGGGAGHHHPDRGLVEVRAAGVRARHARPLRLRPPAARRRARADLARRHPDRRDQRRRGRGRRERHRSPASSPRSARAPTSRARPGRSPPWRTSSPASRCCSSRRPGREVSDKVVRDQIVVVKGRISRRDDQPVALRLRGDASPS